MPNLCLAWPVATLGRSTKGKYQPTQQPSFCTNSCAWAVPICITFGSSGYLWGSYVIQFIIPIFWDPTFWKWFSSRPAVDEKFLDSLLDLLDWWAESSAKWLRSRDPIDWLKTWVATSNDYNVGMENCSLGSKVFDQGTQDLTIDSHISPCQWAITNHC